MTKFPFTAVVDGLTYHVTRTTMKRMCPYCGWPIKHGTGACESHSDLLALDLEQTGWTPGIPSKPVI